MFIFQQSFEIIRKLECPDPEVNTAYLIRMTNVSSVFVVTGWLKVSDISEGWVASPDASRSSTPSNLANTNGLAYVGDLAAINCLLCGYLTILIDFLTCFYCK